METYFPLPTTYFFTPTYSYYYVYLIWTSVEYSPLEFAKEKERSLWLGRYFIISLSHALELYLGNAMKVSPPTSREQSSLTHFRFRMLIFILRSSTLTWNENFVQFVAYNIKRFCCKTYFIMFSSVCLRKEWKECFLRLKI